MNTAVLDLHPPALEAEPQHRTAAPAWAEAQPACWRSEAFAEDLADLLQPSAPSAHATPARPLLRRALGLVLRR